MNAVDKLMAVFLLTLVSISCVLVAAFILGERPELELGHGVRHPQLPAMMQGGDGAARHGHILELGWAFGVLIVIAMTLCLALGMAEQARVGRALLPVLGCGLLGVAVISLLMHAYKQSLGEEELRLLFGLPLPTAWLLGVWFYPVAYVAVFFAFFRRSYFTVDAEKRFERLSAEREDTAD